MGREERRNQQEKQDPGAVAIAEIQRMSRQMLMDRFGNPVIEGATYTFNPSQPHVFRVHKVTPILAQIPGLPPDQYAYRVEFHCVVVNTMIGGQAAEELMLVKMPAPPPEPPPTEPPAGIVLTDTPDNVVEFPVKEEEPPLPFEPAQTEPPTSPNVAAEEPPHGQDERDRS